MSYIGLQVEFSFTGDVVALFVRKLELSWWFSSLTRQLITGTPAINTSLCIEGGTKLSGGGAWGTVLVAEVCYVYFSVHFG